MHSDGAGQWVQVADLNTGQMEDAGFPVMVLPGGATLESFVGHESPPLAGWVLPIIIILCVLMVSGLVFTWWYRRRNKRRAEKRRQDAQAKHAYEKEHALEIAEKQHEEALKAQKRALELKKKDLTYPDTWKMIRKSPALPPMPDEGKNSLIDVEPHTEEYWNVYDLLTKKPDASCATAGSDRNGLHDAWITKLQRIQNTSLFVYNDFQRSRLAGQANIKKDQVKSVQGWHGTGNFDAVNIYNDQQDGALQHRISDSLRRSLSDPMCVAQVS
jgi:hypothetical protein